MPVIDQPACEIDYTNWRGERALRQVHIERIVYKESEWHKGSQWIVEGIDQKQNVRRDFALEGIHSWNLGDKLLTHALDEEPIEQIVLVIREEIRKRGDLPGFSVSDQETLLEQLASFDFGRFYLRNRGLNGYWTDYVVSYPERKTKASGLEAFLLERAPVVLATQERYQHFQKAIQARLKGGMTLASVPCGVMGDLLSLDHARAPNVRMIGIDLDPLSLAEGAKRAEVAGLAKACEFRLEDAWELSLKGEVDILVSNGLTIYDPSDAHTIELLYSFFEALKPGGTLITSTLTVPPLIDSSSEWRMDQINTSDLALQKVIFGEIAKAGFGSYRSTRKMTQMLVQAGFEAPEVIWDRAHIFPTLIARKPIAMQVSDH